jgi:hypothetical protein
MKERVKLVRRERERRMKNKKQPNRERGNIWNRSKT